MRLFLLFLLLFFVIFERREAVEVTLQYPLCKVCFFVFNQDSTRQTGYSALGPALVA